MIIKALDFPVHINFDVTFQCNASCSFCYVIDRNNPNEVSIDLDTAKKILDTLAANGVFRINFFGGEPLLVKGLSELIAYAHDLGIRTTLITNGLPLTEAFLDSVDGKLETIAVSIHGLHERHDEILGIKNGFNKLMKKLDLFNGRGINLGINYTVLSGSNKKFLPTVNYFLDKFDVSFVAANRFVGGRGKNDSALTPSLADLNGVLSGFEEIESTHPEVELSYAIYFPFCLVEKRDHLRFLKGCGMGSNFASVDFKGNVRLCSYSEGVLGNVLIENARDIWLKNPILQNYRNGEWVLDSCQKCVEFDACRGGCRVSDPSLDFGPDILLKLHPYQPYLKAPLIMEKEFN